MRRARTMHDGHMVADKLRTLLSKRLWDFTAIVLVAFALCSCVAREGNGDSVLRGGTELRTWTDSSGFTTEEIVRRASTGELVLHGEQRIRRPNGQLYIVQNYDNGLLHGAFEKYDQHGRVNLRATYVHGALCGPMTSWDHVHDLVTIEMHWQGRLHGPTYTATTDGKVLDQSSYLWGRRHGMWMLFDYDAGIAIGQQFVLGEPVGDEHVVQIEQLDKMPQDD
jgi:hypothetical protein